MIIDLCKIQHVSCWSITSCSTRTYLNCQIAAGKNWRQCTEKCNRLDRKRPNGCPPSPSACTVLDAYGTIASLQGTHYNCNKKPDELVPYEQQSSAVCCFTLSTSLTRFATVFSRRFILISSTIFSVVPEPDEMVSDEQQSSPVCCFNLSISLTRFAVFQAVYPHLSFT
jgi:hypothetical protein